MQKNHTPGPWSGDADGHITKGRNRLLIAKVSLTGMGYAADANTRLIAAAPMLLKALQRLSHPMADDEDLDFAREVITRATGA